MIPRTGHTINLEEPATFNAVVELFLHDVECDRWGRQPGFGGPGYLLVPKDK